MYDFDTLHDRRQSGSVKWDTGKRIFSGGDNFIPMWIADTDFATLPEIPRAIEARLEHPLFGYCTEPPAFFDSLTRWLSQRHGWTVRPDWIVQAEGVVNAVALAINALTAEGGPVVVQTPCYDNFYKVIRNNGRKLVPNPLKLEDGRYTLDLEGLERIFADGAKTLLFCNPHNPTGRVWTKSELEQVADLCLRYDVRVISDDIHCDVVFPGHTYTPLASVREHMAGRTITCYSPGKTFNVPALKAAAAVIPGESMRDAFRSWQERMFLPKLNVLSYEAFAAAYTHGGRYADELSAYVAGNAAFVRGFLRERLPAIHPIAIEGTFLMLWDCTGLGRSGWELVTFFAKHAGVAFSSGDSYGADLGGWVRVNLGCSRALLARAMEQVAQAVETQLKTD